MCSPIRRRADRDQLKLTVLHPLLGVGREPQSAGIGIALDDGVEARLMDGDLARLEHRDLARVDVDADHLVAGIRETGSRDEPHVAGSKDRNAHA